MPTMTHSVRRHCTAAASSAAAAGDLCTAPPGSIICLPFGRPASNVVERKKVRDFFALLV